MGPGGAEPGGSEPDYCSVFGLVGLSLTMSLVSARRSTRPPVPYHNPTPTILGLLFSRLNDQCKTDILKRTFIAT